MKYLKYKFPFYQEVTSDFGIEASKYNAGNSILNIHKCRTSNISPYLAIRYKESLIIEDYRFYEYAVALAIGLLGNSVDEQRFGDWKDYSSKVLTAFFFELKYNSKKEWIADIYYHHFFTQGLSILDILPFFIRKKHFEANEPMYYFMTILPMIVITHEEQHYFFRTDSEYERELQQSFLFQTLKTSEKYWKEEKSKELFNLNTTVMSFYLQLTKDNSTLKLTLEEVLCDLTLLKRTFQMFIENSQSISIEKLIFLLENLATAHFLYIHALCIFEFIRLRVEKPDSIYGDDLNNSLFHMFAARTAFIFMGILTLVENYQAKSNIDLNIIKPLCISFEKIYNTWDEMVSQIDTFLIYSDGWHNMAMDVIKGNNLSIEDCIKIVEQGWTIQDGKYENLWT